MKNFPWLLITVLISMLTWGEELCAQSRTPILKKKFTERHALSSLGEQSKRFKWSKALLSNKEASYKIEKERFNVYVPKSYKRSKKKFGLFVWIAPSYDGRPPPIWRSRFDKLKLIAIGADRSGNERQTPVRIGLALDAVHNAIQQYRIDSKRVYVGGFSGGGRISTFLTMQYPEIFHGGLYLGGCDFYRNVLVPGGKGEAWQGLISKPKDDRLKAVREKTRHVYLVGAKDEVIKQMKAVKDCALKDGFVFVKYTEMKGLGHRIPDGKWFERSIKYMDKPPIPRPK